jgi:16S rRNA (uracil1498-N3)-methyltransferase
MHIFYHPEIAVGNLYLPDEEAWHALKVLRLTQGSEIVVVDGKGIKAEAIIAGISGKSCIIEVRKLETSFGKRPLKLHMAVAPTKQIERFEIFLEKAVEIGVDEITPLICSNSERQHLRIDRLERIVVAAMKQSLKAYLPKLNEAVKITDFLKQDRDGLVVIAHCRDGNKLKLSNCIKGQQEVTILIGPEGDFTREEVEFATNIGIIPVSLGNSRLRTETAGIVAVHTVNLICG